jgi:hypothetical protein
MTPIGVPMKELLFRVLGQGFRGTKKPDLNSDRAENGEIGTAYPDSL